jgi:hypothetical protein
MKIAIYLTIGIGMLPMMDFHLRMLSIIMGPADGEMDLSLNPVAGFAIMWFFAFMLFAFATACVLALILLFFHGWRSLIPVIPLLLLSGFYVGLYSGGFKLLMPALKAFFPEESKAIAELTGAIVCCSVYGYLLFLFVRHCIHQRSIRV